MLKIAFLPFIISSTDNSEFAGRLKQNESKIKEIYFNIIVLYFKIMNLLNNVTEYGFISKIFHWLTAAVLLVQVPLGFYLVDLDFGEKRIIFENIHVTLGVFIFYIVLARLIYKVFNPTPSLGGSIFPGQRLIAKLNHFFLYISILIITISGSLKKLFNGEKIDFFFIDLKIKDNFDLADFFYDIHIIGNYILIFLVLLHITAVFIHRLLFKENLLKKIL